MSIEEKDTGDRDDIFSTDDEFGGFDADFGEDEEDVAEAVEVKTDTADVEQDTEPVEEAPEEEPAEDDTEPEPEVEPELEPSEEDNDDEGEEDEDTAEIEDEVEESEEEPDESAKETGGRPALKKRARIPLTKRQKVLRVILRRAGLEELPDLEVIMRDKEGVPVEIRDLALFIDEPSDEILAHIAKDVTNRNIVNLSAEVEKNRVVTVGAEILKAGRMFQPIQVADITEDGKPTGNLQCTSGRHRLAFLALAYGPGATIPVYVENMTLNEARDAVVVANQARPTRARERAEHAVLGAVGGNADAEQKAIYEATATTKAKARKYCVYSVFEKGHPMNLDFKVSAKSSRKGGGLTTVSNIENFWGAALAWDKDTEWKRFDADLKDSIKFLNSLTEAMQQEEDFDPTHHMASMTLSAIGKWYRNYREITGEDATSKAAIVAKCIVNLGEIGRQKSDATYESLTAMMRS